MRFARQTREWAPPPEFDGFRVRGPLGEGGMGTVYRADDVALDRPVALKFVRENGDPRAHERFVIEARALARLVHPNVVQVYRVGEVEGRAYLAYELVEGRSLAAVRGPVEWAFALDVGIGIARGLAAVHARGLLHRDLKPSNVVVTADGEPKLIDFGLARAIDAELEATPSWADDPTAPAGPTSIGRIVGTPQYMAPELFRGEPATVRSDVYSVGLLLHELLTGAQLRVGRRLAEIAIEALDRDVPPVFRSDVPRGVLDVVAACVRRDPALRCRSADELRESLELVRSYHRPFVDPSVGRDADALAERVAASFARVAAGGDRLVVRFYELLFALDARQRALFPEDLAGQRRKFMHMVEVIVAQLRAPERLVPMLEDLGRRHASYGVTAAHVELAYRALLSAVRDLDPELDDATDRAWVTALDRLSEALRRGISMGSAVSARTIPPTAGSSIDARQIDIPATCYIDRDGVAIAYQTLGEGPLDVVLVPGLVNHLELAWEHPASASLLRGIGELGRLVILDKRGTGLSERMVHSRSLEDHAGDLVAVMDAVGSERAVLVGVGDGAAIALATAALHPSRVRALALHAPIAMPGALSHSDALIAEVRRRWGGPVLLDTIAPTLHGEVPFRDLWASTLRTGSSPAALVAMLSRAAATDVGALLPFVGAPAVVLHRRGDRLVPLEASRALAAELAAEVIVLDGVDHLPCSGAPGRWLDALEDALADLAADSARAAESTGPLETWATVAAGDDAARCALVEAGGSACEGAFVLPSPRAAIDAARVAIRSGARGIVISARREDASAIEPGIVLVDPIGELVLGSDVELTPIPGTPPRRWRVG